MGDANFTQFLEQRYRPFVAAAIFGALHDGCGARFAFRAGHGPRAVRRNGLALDPRRFRANFYVRWECDEPFYENQLVGRALRIGEDVTVQVVKKDGRCVMITLDPETAARSPVVLEKVAREHDGCAGVYGAVLREGIVRADDPVYLV